MKQLRDIVQHGGSVQSNDALEYEEYLALRNGQFDEAIVSAYQAQVFALNERIMDFYKRNLSEHKMPAMRALTDGIAHAVCFTFGMYSLFLETGPVRILFGFFSNIRIILNEYSVTNIRSNLLSGPYLFLMFS
jgi:hypothetical protein